MNEELPKDWKWVKFGDVIDLQSGVAFKKSEYSKSGVRLFQIANVSFNYIKWEEIEFLPTNYIDKYPELLLKSGDIVMALNRPLLNDQLKVAEIKKSDVPAILYQRVGRFKFLNGDNSHYFLYFLQSPIFIKWLKEELQGVNIPFINKSKLLSFHLFPKPSLNEQQAIVSKIEELFSELEKGIESLFTAKQQLKTYRQSVLNKLISKENLMSIEKVIDKLDQGWSPKCENEASKDKKEWAVIKTSAVQHGYFIAVENKRLPKNLKPREQHELKAGDILITRAGPRVRVGVCCMIKNTRPKHISCDKVYRIKVNRKIVSPEYFEFILNTLYYQDVIERMKTGISDSGLNLTQKAFVQIEIPIPTIEEQNKIVQFIDSRLSVADKMDESITQSLQQAEALKQSILKKAFEGELIKIV